MKATTKKIVTIIFEDQEAKDLIAILKDVKVTLAGSTQQETINDTIDALRGDL
jgi:hypothetical protein